VMWEEGCVVGTGKWKQLRMVGRVGSRVRLDRVCNALVPLVFNFLFTMAMFIGNKL